MTPFFKTLFPNWLCYKLTQNAPNLTYSDLGFKKFSRGRNPPDPRFWRGRFVVERGWGGRGKGKGRGGKRWGDVEGPGKWSVPAPALALSGPGPFPTDGGIRLVKHANLGCNHVSSCCIIHCTNDLMRFFTKHTAFTANNVQTRPELAGDLIENAGEAYEKWVVYLGPTNMKIVQKYTIINYEK